MKRPPKMNKIARISVRNIRRIDLIKIEKLNQVSTFLHEIFGIDSLLNCDLIVDGNF